jgi:DNA polymerase-1
VKPATREAYELMHKGSLALARMERNGFAVDRAYLKQAQEEIVSDIKSREEAMRADPLWKRWKKIHGVNAKLTARNQLMSVLIAEKLVKSVTVTSKGNIRGDRNALERVDHPFVKAYLETEKLRKLEGTYIQGIERESATDNLLHGFFNLHLVTSYRGSADSPNLQNIPVRDPYISKMIRRAFIPRAKNRRIVEIDFSGIEVRISAVYNKDPQLIAYLAGHGDMHRDAAADLYCCTPDQVSKTMRGMVKNQYVFPEFYGSYYKQCAPALWESIDRYNFEVDGIPMRKWLKRKGIRELGDCDLSSNERPRPGTFEKHVADAENVLWNERFRVYRDWKNSWYEKYLRRGYLRYKTGFVVDSVLNRKEACNWPIQGTAFHCLLWSLIEIDRLVRKRGIDALLVSQIHDSLIADVHEDDVDDYIALAVWVMTRKLVKHWDWINVPLEVEAEVAASGLSWHDKKVYDLSV